MRANDGDIGATPTDIVYSLLTNSGTGDIFTVEGTSDNAGDIILNTKLDRETKKRWEFLVVASDDGGQGLEGYATVSYTSSRFFCNQFLEVLC